jgi:hypothetical protein
MATLFSLFVVLGCGNATGGAVGPNSTPLDAAVSGTAAPAGPSRGLCPEMIAAIASMDEKTQLGRSPNEFAALMRDRPPADLEWNEIPAGHDGGIFFDWVRVQAPSGKTRLTTGLEAVTGADYVSRSRDPGVQVGGPGLVSCLDQVWLHGVLKFSTLDHAFDEHWPVTVKVEVRPTQSPEATYEIDLGMTAIAGTFRVERGNVDPRTEVRAWIQGTLPQLTGQVNVAEWRRPDGTMGSSAILGAWGNRTDGL